LSAPALKTEEPSTATPATPKKRGPMPYIVGLVAVVVLGYMGKSWWTGRNYEDTDDAYVTADIVQVNTEVKGKIINWAVKDNEVVKAGQEIATLDPSQVQVNLLQAQAALESANASAVAAGTDVDLTKSQGEAQIQGAQGGESAANGGIGSADAQINVLRAQVRTAQANALVAKSDISSLENDIQSAQDSLLKAQTQVKAAAAAVSAAQNQAKAATSSVKTAQSNLDLAQKNFARIQSLFSEGVISQASLDQSQTTLDSDTAAVEAAQHQADSAQSMVLQRQSDLDTANAGVQVAQTAVQQARERRSQGYDRLRAAQAGVSASQATVKAAQSAAATAQGSYQQAQANLATAQTLPEKLKQKDAQKALALAKVKEAQVAVENAKLDLERTHIKAPVDGIVSKRFAQVGTLLQLGSPVASIVPTQNIYIVANFKETQIGRMQAGQDVEIDIDGFGGHTFHGKVDSLSAATGSSFAMIPPDNATGNFVKVVQRVPVKILLTPDDQTSKIASGMSADVKVKVAN
jgi:membrane fusion protein, multidrug efflux system